MCRACSSRHFANFVHFKCFIRDKRSSLLYSHGFLGFAKFCLLLGCSIIRTASQCPDLKTAASDIHLSKLNKARFDCVIDLGEQPEAAGKNMSQAKHQDDSAKSSTNTSHLLVLVCLLTSLLLTTFFTYFFTYRNRNVQPQLKRSRPKTCPVSCPVDVVLNYQNIQFLPPSTPVPVPYNNPY